MENRSARACCREFCAPPRLRPSRRDVQNRPHAASATTATGSEPGKAPVASAAALREIEPPRFRGRVAEISSSPRACGHLGKTCRTDPTLRPQRPPRAPNPAGTPLRPLRRCVRSNRRGFAGVLPKSLRPPSFRPSRRDVQNRFHAAPSTTATGSEPGRHPVASAAALREIEPPRLRVQAGIPNRKGRIGQHALEVRTRNPKPWRVMHSRASSSRSGWSRW